MKPKVFNLTAIAFSLVLGIATAQAQTPKLLASTPFDLSAVAKADVVLDWNAIAVETAVANHQNPFAQARYAAIVQLAVFEAVNSITGEYKPYLGTITAPPGASAEAAAIEAAYHVLSTYFPASSSALLAARTNSVAH